MCGRYSAYIDLLAASEDLGAELVAQGFEPSANVAPMQSAPLLVDRGGRRLGLARFGWVLPPREPRERPLTVINARSETASASRVFRDALSKRRGVALADGYYEWQTLGEPGKTPYFLSAPGERFLLLAALFEVDPSAQPADRHPRFTLFTREARGVAARVHDRMPVFVPRDRLDGWLDPARRDGERQLAALAALPAALVAHPVSRDVGKVANRGASLREPVGPALGADPR